ncbi:MAG: histidine phosphatase family protein [Patescibacteria group bacterium]
MKHGTLVIARHGESRLNALNRFSGWLDITLNKKGLDEAHRVADHCQHFDYDTAFTSRLERAHETLSVILSHQKKIGVFQHKEDHRYNHLKKTPKKFVHEILPVFTSENLNERSYGDLQGLDKNVASQMFGTVKVLKWRRDFKERPPGGESLQDVYNRVTVYFEKNIHPRIKQGEKVLVVAHGNTLRAIIKFLEHIDDNQIPFVDLPTGQPLVYSCRKNQFARIEGEYRFDRPLR